jgi:hypothetical protein
MTTCPFERIPRVLDFNRTNVSDDPLSEKINALVELVEPREENTRQYLGASAIGSKCLRKVQFDWDPIHPVRFRNVFARGHFFEELTREQLKRAGFLFAPAERLSFEALGGLFRGHAECGPALPGVGYPCLWEHKCLRAKNWRALDRDGLDKAFPQYAAQVAIYQAYRRKRKSRALHGTQRRHLRALAPACPFQCRARAALERSRGHGDRSNPRRRAFAPSDRRPEDWHCRMCGCSEVLAWLNSRPLHEALPIVGDVDEAA